MTDKKTGSDSKGAPDKKRDESAKTLRDNVVIKPSGVPGSSYSDGRGGTYVTGINKPK